jgi:hypothetical protein
MARFTTKTTSLPTSANIATKTAPAPSTTPTAAAAAAIEATNRAKGIPGPTGQSVSTSTGGSGSANGYISRPNQAKYPSRAPRKVIFGAGGTKSAPVAATKKS